MLLSAAIIIFIVLNILSTRVKCHQDYDFNSPLKDQSEYLK